MRCFVHLFVTLLFLCCIPFLIAGCDSGWSDTDDFKGAWESNQQEKIAVFKTIFIVFELDAFDECWDQTSYRISRQSGDTYRLTRDGEAPIEVSISREGNMLTIVWPDRTTVYGPAANDPIEPLCE